MIMTWVQCTIFFHLTNDDHLESAMDKCWVVGTDVREQTLRQGLSGSRVRDDTDADRELPSQVVRGIVGRAMGTEGVHVVDVL